MIEDNTLEELKQEADKLGIKYNNSIGLPKLQEKISSKLKQKEKTNSHRKNKAVKLTKEEEAILKAKNRVKVKIINIDQNNSSATTVFAGVLNNHITLQRVIPLNVEVAVEQCLLDQIEMREYTHGISETGPDGLPTGNFKTVTDKAFQIVKL